MSEAAWVRGGEYVGEAKRSGEGDDVAHQHAGGALIDDERLKRLIQEAVDEALRAIARGEGQVDALAHDVARRLGERAALAAPEFAALEARLHGLEAQLRAVDDRHGRVEARVDDLSFHIGHKDTLDLRKVPPDILERSFQTALDDLTGELSKIKGRDELERLLEEALADVRGRSKGSELFERAESRIVIRGLARAVSKKLLSPKAALATFDEVVKYLRIHLPAYRPRSLSSLIRARGSEFAIESALRHHDRLESAEATLETLLDETRRIEKEARAADDKAAESVSRSFMQAVAERRSIVEEFQGRIKSLEKRASDAEDRLEKALERLESVERYSQRVESAMIRRTKEGTFKGDFTPVIEAVHEALKDGKARTVAELASRVKGVDREVVEAVVREGVREGDFEDVRGGKVRAKR